VPPEPIRRQRVQHTGRGSSSSRRVFWLDEHNPAAVAGERRLPRGQGQKSGCSASSQSAVKRVTQHQQRPVFGSDESGAQQQQQQQQQQQEQVWWCPPEPCRAGAACPSRGGLSAGGCAMNSHKQHTVWLAAGGFISRVYLSAAKWQQQQQEQVWWCLPEPC
jgi:hypothetical protein